MISLRHNIAAVANKAKRMVTQIPYATARAINKCAAEVQKAEGENLQDKQTIRSEWWKPGRKFGVNIRPFAKWHKPEAIVGNQADWMKRHEEGGVKTPKDGKALAIPTEEQRGGKMGIMSRPKKPKAAIRAGAFAAEMPSGMAGIWKRVGKERLPLRLLFTFTKKANIKKGLNFVGLGERIVDKLHAKIFQREYAQAIREFWNR